MKFRSLVLAAMLLAGCASQQPQSVGPVLSDTPAPKSQTKNRDRDSYECEREAAFAGAADKRRVFDNCMKARGYTPFSTDQLEWPHTQ
jgi:PBP1b-binding outer membrane lipoprotein LpoB